MQPYTPIEFERSACNCPLCGAYSEQHWSYAKKVDKKTANYGGNETPKEYITELVFSQCMHCKKHSVWKEDRDNKTTLLLYPNGGSAPLPNPDMADDIQVDFNEARNIVELSPRGASALLRLVVQKICKQLGEKGENINDDIRKLVAKGLPEKMQRALDSVRVVGNNAVHPGQIDLIDDRETAYKLFAFINIIVDLLITQPKQIDDFYDLKIPDEAKAAINRRDGKI